MFIYILNLLNDGVKKENRHEFSNIEIINDAKYISALAGIKKNCDFKNFSDKILDIFQLLNKYNVTARNSIEILNKLILNENNSWVLENVDNKNTKSKPEFVLSSIINNILEESKINEDYIKVNSKSVRKDNIKKIEDYYVKFRESKGIASESMHKRISIRNEEKVYELSEKFKTAGYYIVNESRVL